MVKIYTLCALGLLAAPAFAQFETPGDGTAYTFASLSQTEDSGVTVTAEKTYLLSADLTIAAGDKLTIESGDNILFADAVTLNVNGDADFTPEQQAFISPASGDAKPRGIVLAGKANLKNLVVKGGGIMYGGSEPLLVEYCDFSEINSIMSGYGVIVLNCTSTDNRIAHCTFTDCEPGAINTPANVGVQLDIDSNTITNVSTLNQMRPFINITVCADREIVVRNNILNGAKLSAPGGIGISNMLNMPGENKVLVENNTVTDCSWGLNFVGGMDIRIIGNIVKHNCWDPDVNGGIGATLYSLPDMPQSVYAERNTFEGNKWGPIVMGGTVANFGKTENPDAEDYNPGLNIFRDNGHDDNGTRVMCDFCNTTSETVYAQGNYWNDATTAEEVAATVMDNNYSSAYGPVVYTPFAVSGISSIRTDDSFLSFDGDCLRTALPVAITVYDLSGRLLLSSDAKATALPVNTLPAGVYVATAGNQSIKFRL